MVRAQYVISDHDDTGKEVARIFRGRADGLSSPVSPSNSSQASCPFPSLSCRGRKSAEDERKITEA